METKFTKCVDKVSTTVQNKRMTTTATTNIYDSETNELIGPATEAQIEASRVDPEIDPYGFILIDADGDVVQDGTWDAQQPGTRKVYVS